MRREFIRSSIRFLRRLQLIGGGIAVLLGIAIVLRFLQIDTVAGNSPENSGYAVVVLMLVVPAVLLLLGSIIQLILAKNWALIPVLIGGLLNLIFVGVNAGFLFVYINDTWGKLAVLTDLVVIVMTIGVAILNLTLPMTLKATVHK